MKRSKFLKAISLIPFSSAAMNSVMFSRLKDNLPKSQRMPVMFVGHGSPMNAIEDNIFSAKWRELGEKLPQPKAVLVVSAHWLSEGTYVTAMENPEKINDFGGFPQKLFDAPYPAKGNPALAKEIKEIVKSTNIGLDHNWGIDHGAWSVLKQMYPKADIPVLQLSIDYYKPAAYHYELAKQLSALRDKGVLIMGSGNLVHNLSSASFGKGESIGFGFDWAIEANELFKKHILDGNHKPLLEYQKLGSAVMRSVPSPDHYYPAMYALGLQDKKDELSLFNDKMQAGSLSMTSILMK